MNRGSLESTDSWFNKKQTSHFQLSNGRIYSLTGHETAPTCRCLKLLEVKTNVSLPPVYSALSPTADILTLSRSHYPSSCLILTEIHWNCIIWPFALTLIRVCAWRSAVVRLKTLSGWEMFHHSAAVIDSFCWELFIKVHTSSHSVVFSFCGGVNNTEFLHVKTMPHHSACITPWLCLHYEEASSLIFGTTTPCLRRFTQG